MFENEERSNLKDVPPAKHRIKEYKRKTFGKIMTQRYDNDRPQSGVTSLMTGGA